jgi:LacI family transcriptional regulator
MAQRVTLKTIAQYTGLSVTTVSRALTNYSDVAVETRDKIFAAAEELGYYPNQTARQLQKQRTDTIGLILPTYGPRFNDPYFSQLIAGIGDELALYNFDLLLSTRAPGVNEIEAYRHMVEGRRVDGLIVVRTRKQDARISYLCGTSFPFVAFGRSDLNVDFPYIDEDGNAGFLELTNYLISLGHHRIAFISPPMDLTFSKYRLSGYQQALLENGIAYNPAYVIQGDLTRRGGEYASRELLGLAKPPTAIVAANDLMAISAISVANELGLNVGTDISIAGFDDVPPADILSLTTLRQPIYDIGKQLSEMVVKLILNKSIPDHQILLKPELIIRSSTGLAPKS